MEVNFSSNLEVFLSESDDCLKSLFKVSGFPCFQRKHHFSYFLFVTPLKMFILCKSVVCK